jgi:hypothetical protein
MNRTALVQSWLSRSWWIVVPPFMILVARLVYERTCAEPYELLPLLTSQPLLAWALAALYVAAHCWAVAAYLVTVDATNTLLPSWSASRKLWGPDWLKVVATLAILILEYWSIPFWRLLGHSVLHCRVDTL